MPMLNKVKNSNEQGVTLIEVLAALVLLLILSTTIIAVFTPASLWIQQARNETTASNYARAVLEDLRSDRAQIKLGNSDKYADEIWSPHSYQPPEPPDMRAKLDIRTASQAGIDPESDLANLYAVTVKVIWNNDEDELIMQTVIRGVGE